VEIDRFLVVSCLLGVTVVVVVVPTSSFSVTDMPVPVLCGCFFCLSCPPILELFSLSSFYCSGAYTIDPREGVAGCSLAVPQSPRNARLVPLHLFALGSSP
jgi:hypothetical protein